MSDNSSQIENKINSVMAPFFKRLLKRLGISEEKQKEAVTEITEAMPGMIVQVLPQRMLSAMKDDEKPKRGRSAFIIFSTERRPELKEEEPMRVESDDQYSARLKQDYEIDWDNLSPKAKKETEKKYPRVEETGKEYSQRITQLLGKEWRELSEEDKAEYKEKAQKDAEEKKKELEKYQDSAPAPEELLLKQKNSRSKTSSVKKEAKQKTRATAPFNLWYADVMGTHKQLKNLTGTDRLKKAREMWKEMKDDDSIKVKYTAQSKAEQDELDKINGKVIKEKTTKTKGDKKSKKEESKGDTKKTSKKGKKAAVLIEADEDDQATVPVEEELEEVSDGDTDNEADEYEEMDLSQTQDTSSALQRAMAKAAARRKSSE